MKYYWTAEPEKNFRNRYSGTWKTNIPSNGFKVTRDNYKTILTDPDAIGAAERYFNYHTRAFQCIVTYWTKVDVDGHPGYINPNNEKQLSKYETEIIEDMGASLNKIILQEAFADDEKRNFLDAFFNQFADKIELDNNNEIYFNDEQTRDEAFGFCFDHSTDHSFYSKLFNEKTKAQLYEVLMEQDYDAHQLTSITIPNSITSIDDYAFYYCTKLQSATIANSVTSIGTRAFAHCESLESITIPNSVKIIEDEAFSGCSALTSIVIPNSVTSIGARVFLECKSLESAAVSNRVRAFGGYIFAFCDSLKIITCDNRGLAKRLKKQTSSSKVICNNKEITESLNENLNEDIEKHDTLNPLLWNEDETLKEEVHNKIIEIANDFIDNLKQDGIKFDLKDIRIVGSNCSYNYTKDSDLDVHLIADSSSLNCPDELYPLLYSSYRSIFNKNLDIDFYGIPVEIYVEVE